MQVNDQNDDGAASPPQQKVGDGIADDTDALRNFPVLLRGVEIREDPNCPPGMIFMFRPVDMVAVPLPENWLDQWKDES